MNSPRTRVASVGVALLVVLSVLTVAPVAPVHAAENSFVIEQGEQCVPVTPLEGSEDVESFYDYRNPFNSDGPGSHTYSSFMPGHLTQPESSRLFLYDGPNGVSLVIIHNERAAGAGGSAASFRFSGLPGDGWLLVDDTYPDQDDRVSANAIDWTWNSNRTDGAIYRGIDRADLEITISPRFNDDAALYDDPIPRDGRIERWQVLSGDLGSPEVIDINSMSDPVTLRAGTCEPVDETPPSASFSADPTNASVGEPVAFDASESSDDGTIAEYRWDFGDEANALGRTAAHTYTETGTFTVSLTVVDSAGNTDTTSAEVVVTGNETETPTPTPEPTPTPDPTPEPTPTPTQEPTTTEEELGSGGGGGGGSSSGGYGSGGASFGSDSSSAGDEPPVEMSVGIERQSPNAVRVDVTNAAADDVVRIRPPAGDSNAGAAYRSLDFAFADGGSYSLALHASTDAPGKTPALSVPNDGIEPLSYLVVSHPELDADGISNPTLTFSVEKERLAATGTTAEQVVLSRYDDGEWSALETELVGETPDSYRFAATPPGLSVFAIGTKQPAVSVTDVSLGESTISGGEAVEVTVTVENTGLAGASHTVNLTVFDEVVASRTVTVPAGESVTVSFTQRFDAPGTYDVSVGDATARLDVTGSEPTATESTSNDRGQPGFGLGLTVIAFLAALLLARRHT